MCKHMNYCSKTSYLLIVHILCVSEDEPLYTSPHRAACALHPHNCSDFKLATIITTQQKLGIKGYKNLTPMHASYINMTIFAPKAKNMRNQFEYFHPADCVLI